MWNCAVLTIIALVVRGVYFKFVAYLVKDNQVLYLQDRLLKYFQWLSMQRENVVPTVKPWMEKELINKQKLQKYSSLNPLVTMALSLQMELVSRDYT